MNKLSSRVASLSNLSHTVLAYDLWNEPCYHDLSNDKTKQQTCEIIDMWYNTVKSHGPTPLVTLGTCGSGDEWFYDPAVIKVDFHSLHVYPHWPSFEDKTDPTMQQRALSRIYDELYWFNKASPVPWIMGEIGFTASANLPVQPVGGTNGTLQEQANFAQAVMDATCNCGGSGFSWWAFQDGYWNTTDPGSNHYGMLERGYVTPASSGGGLPEKLVANVFDSYIKPLPVSSCGPCPVTAADLQTYDPALTFFNPFQHPPNPSRTIKGYVYDQDGNPIANAYVGGHMFAGLVLGFEVNPFYRLFTDESGYFEIIPYDFILPNTNLDFEGDLHSLLLTSAGGERLKYSEKWLSNACSSIMPTPNNSHSWLINRTNYEYNGEFINIYVVNGENRNIESYDQLTIETSIFYSGAISDIRAKSEVHIKSGVHAQLGSSIHIYCEETSINCINYNGYTMEYKLPGNPLLNSVVSKPFLELQFNKQKNTSSFFATPNPTNSFFQLHSESNEAVEINMLNMLGEFVTSVRFKNTSELINVAHLAKGVYLLKELNTGEVQKLILQ